MSVVCQSIGYVDESNVYFCIGRDVTSANTVGLTQPTAHCDAVNGMAQAFFGDGYHELGTVGTAAGVQSPYGAPWVGHNAIVPAVFLIGRREQFFDCSQAAKFFFLI